LKFKMRKLIALPAVLLAVQRPNSSIPRHFHLR